MEGGIYSYRLTIEKCTTLKNVKKMNLKKNVFAAVVFPGGNKKKAQDGMKLYMVLKKMIMLTLL